MYVPDYRSSSFKTPRMLCLIVHYVLWVPRTSLRRRLLDTSIISVSFPLKPPQKFAHTFDWVDWTALGYFFPLVKLGIQGGSKNRRQLLGSWCIDALSEIKKKTDQIWSNAISKSRITIHEPIVLSRLAYSWHLPVSRRADSRDTMYPTLPPLHLEWPPSISATWNCSETAHWDGSFLRKNFCQLINIMLRDREEEDERKMRPGWFRVFCTFTPWILEIDSF